MNTSSPGRSDAPSAGAENTMNHIHNLSHDLTHDLTHDHAHNQSHPHVHHPDHAPRPPSSPLGSGLDLRLLIAAAAIGLLWLAVLWALR